MAKINNTSGVSTPVKDGKKMTNPKTPLLPLSPTLKTRSFRAHNPRKIQLTFIGQGRTQQQFKAESDINTIMGQYMRTGVMPSLNDPNTGRYIDATGLEYQAAMEMVASANSMFHNLPSALRARFSNNPAEFLNFAENPDNQAELSKLGVKRASDSEARRGDAQTQNQGGSPTTPAKTSPTPLPASGEGSRGEGSQPAKPV
ncbi:MAG: internal scaffolding protein [Microvirus sp.]|nr:MAG: internal scaffolding protein [Microvirus sp.]